MSSSHFMYSKDCLLCFFSLFDKFYTYSINRFYILLHFLYNKIFSLSLKPLILEYLFYVLCNF